MLVYLSNHNIWSEPKCFSNAPKEAFDIPKVFRTFNKDCGCKVSFYKLDTEMVGVCGYNHATSKYDSYSVCAYWGKLHVTWKELLFVIKVDPSHISVIQTKSGN